MFETRIMRDDMQSVAATIAKVFPGRAPMPVLDNTRITCGGGVATFMTTDYDVTLTQWVDGIGDTPAGGILVPFRNLLKLLRASATGEKPSALRDQLVGLRVQGVGEPVHFTCGDYSLPVNQGSNPDVRDHPEPPKTPLPADLHVRVAVAPDRLRVALQHAVTAAAKTDELPVLATVNLSWCPQSQTLRTVATDRYRMDRTDLPVDFFPVLDLVAVRPDTPASVNVPVRAVTGVLSVFAHTDEPITVTWWEDGVSFATSRAELHCRPVTGDYPRVQSIIEPDSVDSWGIIPREPLTAAVRKSAAMAAVHNPKEPQVDLVFGDGFVQVSPVGGKGAKVSCDAPGIVNRQPGYRFHGKFLQDCLDTLTGDTVHVATEDWRLPRKPWLFESGDAVDHRHAVMPATWTDEQ